ncbi:MAG TPA: stage V sporulation protein B [Clostridia bacterium]|nr:stage V sporulation protein B [Clostridia bacterium]
MRKGFLRGVLILTAGSMLTRILGFVYRIYVVRLLGAEGIGLYEMVFPVVTLILVITTAGIPVAVAKLVADSSAQGRHREIAVIVHVSLALLALTGIVVPSALMYGASWFIPLAFSDPRVYWPFMALIPAVFLVSLSSVLRGYYQGINYMVPLAVGPLVEQITRFFAGITLVCWLLPYGLEFGAGALALAVVLGELAGLTVLVAFYWTNRPPALAREYGKPPGVTTVMKQLWHFSVPVTLARILASLMLSAKAIMIPQRLQLAGATVQQATQLYGAFSGMAMSLINFPTVITGSLSSVLLPTIASALTQKEYAALALRVNQAFKITVLTALPASVLFFFLAEPLTQVFFHSREAAVPLQWLAPGCIFLYLQQTTAGILYGMGKMGRLLGHSLFGNGVGLGLTYFLTAVPGFGIAGAALGLVVGAALTCFLNIIIIVRSMPIHFEWRGWLPQALAAAALMAGIVILLEPVLPLLVLVLAAGGFYLASLFALRALGRQDFLFR